MEKITFSKIKSKLRDELKFNCTLSEGENEIKFCSRYFEKDIVTLEDVDEINLNYEKLKIKYSSLDFDEELWSLKRGQKLNWIRDMSEEIIEFRGYDCFYTLLGDVITDIERPYGYKDEILDLLRLGENPILMMNEVEKKMFDELPSILIIYRGVCLKDKDLDIEDYISLNWTLNFETAKWFSDRDSGYKSVVMKYEINKEDVLSYFTRRKEFEIIIDYERIDFKNVEIISIL